MSVRFSPGTFRDLQDGWWNERVVVRSDSPAETLAALERAAARCLRVARSGREHSEADPGGDLDTPNWAQASMRTDGVPELYVDCKSEVGTRRSATLRRIVREELRRAAVIDATVEPCPEDLAMLTTDESVPSWVAFANETLAGMPNSIRPEGHAVVNESCELNYYFSSHSGARYECGWQSILVAASDEPTEVLLRSAIRWLDVIHCPTGTEFRLRQFGNSSLGYRTSVDWADIELYVHALGELRDKTSFLRKRAEKTILVILVIQPCPDALD